MSYIQLNIQAHSIGSRSLLEGWLGENPSINGWEESETGELIAYLPEADFSEDFKAELQKKQQEWGFGYTTAIFEEQNWNAVWEESFQPVAVEGFCRIRASFHAPDPSFAHELVITPQMSFGTGHHATTYMMLENMQHADFKGKSIFDYGCGTGVLAIMAMRLGAATAVGIDIDEWAYRNTLDNIQLNQTPDITVYQGDLGVLPTHSRYDVILANINRNILINAMPQLAALLNKGGQIWLSGFLGNEMPLLLESIQNNGLTALKQQQREQWGFIIAFSA